MKFKNFESHCKPVANNIEAISEVKIICLNSAKMSFDEERRTDNNNRSSIHSVRYIETRTQDVSRDSRDIRDRDRDRYERSRERDRDDMHKRHVHYN